MPTVVCFLWVSLSSLARGCPQLPQCSRGWIWPGPAPQGPQDKEWSVNLPKSTILLRRMMGHWRIEVAALLEGKKLSTFLLGQWLFFHFSLKTDFSFYSEVDSSVLQTPFWYVKGTFSTFRTKFTYEFLGVFLWVIKNPARAQCSVSKTSQSSMFPWKLGILELARHSQQQRYSTNFCSHSAKIKS